MKKLVSLVLVLALVLAMAVPAFASTFTDDPNRDYEIDGTIRTPVVSVKIPANSGADNDGKLVLNPYGLEYKAEVGGTEKSFGTDQIISPTVFIENHSECAVNISVKASAKPSTGLTMATASLSGNDSAAKPVTTKSVFMFFEIDKADDGTNAPDTFVTDIADVKTIKANQMVLSNKDVTKNNMLKLAAPATPLDADTATYAAFHFGGNAVKVPATPWAAEDKVGASVAFIITPAA